MKTLLALFLAVSTAHAQSLLGMQATKSPPAATGQAAPAMDIGEAYSGVIGATRTRAENREGGDVSQYKRDDAELARYWRAYREALARGERHVSSFAEVEARIAALVKKRDTSGPQQGFWMGSPTYETTCVQIDLLRTELSAGRPKAD